MSSRDKALEILKKQMQAQKARLDPKLLQIAGKAAALKQEGIRAIHRSIGRRGHHRCLWRIPQEQIA